MQCDIIAVLCRLGEALEVIIFVCVAWRYIAAQAVCFRELQRVAHSDYTYACELQCIAVSCRQCVAVYCSALQTWRVRISEEVFILL